MQPAAASGMNRAACGGHWHSRRCTMPPVGCTPQGSTMPRSLQVVLAPTSLAAAPSGELAHTRPYAYFMHWLPKPES